MAVQYVIFTEIFEYSLRRSEQRQSEESVCDATKLTNNGSKRNCLRLRAVLKD